jgi:enoyl-CoA hydratase
MTARQISATEAAVIGVLNDAVPAPKLAGATENLVDSLLRAGPLGVRSIKEAMQRGMATDLRAGLEIEHELAERIILTDDFVEGLRAYRANESPHWTGR